MRGWLRRWSSFWICPALAALLIGTAIRSGSMPPPEAALGLALAGLGGWTLVEYLLHRFVFHAIDRAPWLAPLAGRHHRAHHLHPTDADYIFARPVAALAPSAALCLVLYAGLGLGAAASVLAGVWTGFLAYETVHYRVHLHPRGRQLRTHGRRHRHHHFKDETAAFGVTSGFWDRVFGTGISKMSDVK